MSGRRLPRPFSQSSLAGLTLDGVGGALMTIGLIDSVGTGLYLAGSVIFFTRVIDLSAAQVGLGLSSAGLLGLAAQPFVGWAADRWTPRRVLIALNLWRALGFTAYVFTDTFAMFLIVAALLGIGEQAVTPIYQALVERVVGAEQRVRMMARLRSIYNAGFTLGALLCSAAISTRARAGFDAIMLGNAATFVLAALLLPRVRLAYPVGGSEATQRRRPRRLSALQDIRYLAVAAVNGVLSLHMAILAVAMPLWVTLHTSAPPALVGMLLVVNTVSAVVLQVPVARASETLAGSVIALRRAGIALATSCGLFALAPVFGAAIGLIVVTLVLGVAALTASELLQSAGGWGLSYLLAPNHSRAEFLATFNLGASLQFVLGPTLITVGVVDQGALGWLVLAGCFLLMSGTVGPVAAGAARRPSLMAPGPGGEEPSGRSYPAATAEVGS